jgi:hypothetical protein
MKTAGLLLVLGLVACGGPNRTPGSGGRGPGGGNDGMGGGDPGSGPIEGAAPCAKMDIVFVVDDSGSMGEEQTNLAQNFPKFISVLNAYRSNGTTELDYRVGVTTTGRDVSYTTNLPFVGPITQNEKGDNGALRQGQQCGMTRRWIEKYDHTDVAMQFGCVAKVGTQGSSLEMPLAAARLALGDRVKDGTNAGFLRDDALLAMVILTDEDDQSRDDNNFTLDPASPSSAQLPPVDDYVKFFDSAKGGHGRWAAAVIAGPGPGRCSSQFGDADEASRLREFVQKTGKEAVFSSICDGDLTGALDDALQTFSAACESFPPIL